MSTHKCVVKPDKTEDNRKDVILTLNKNWIFDTVSINWNGVKILEEDEPIPLPSSVPVLLKHKVKTRNILSQDYEIQYPIKQGTNWLNMTKHYKSAKRGLVKKACESIKMIPFSADTNVKSQEATQSGLDPNSNPLIKAESIYSLYSVCIYHVLLLLFRRSYCRVPTGTPTKPVATVGRAYGQWYKRNHSFIFRLPLGVCKASATFTGTSGIHEFQFRSGFCQAFHIP